MKRSPLKIIQKPKKNMMIHKNIIKIRVLVLLFCLSPVGLTLAATKDKPVYFALTQQQWSVPRTAESVLAMPAVHKVVNSLLDKKGYALRIRYPGGEVGILWASELKGWLVSLGLASGYIELQPGGLNVQEIELSINKILY